MATTVAILGATGKTGKWALKGALTKDWSVRLLVRNPAKVESLIKELFPAKSEDEIKSLSEQRIVAVKGTFDEADRSNLVQVLEGAHAVLSFVGMVKKGENVVEPAARAVVGAMESLGERAPKKFICMSSIGFNDGKAHGYKAWGYVTMSATKCVPALKSSFADLAMAERFIFSARTANPALNIIIVRGSILEDKKNYLCDYGTSEKNYNLVKVGENGPFSFSVDRQHVAQAFLSLCEDSTGFDNQNVSCFTKKEAKSAKKGSQ